jgi:hypothetical protein
MNGHAAQLTWLAPKQKCDRMSRKCHMIQSHRSQKFQPISTQWDFGHVLHARTLVQAVFRAWNICLLMSSFCVRQFSWMLISTSLSTAKLLISKILNLSKSFVAAIEACDGMECESFIVDLAHRLHVFRTLMHLSATFYFIMADT